MLTIFRSLVLFGLLFSAFAVNASDLDRFQTRIVGEETDEISFVAKHVESSAALTLKFIDLSAAEKAHCLLAQADIETLLANALANHLDRTRQSPDKPFESFPETTRELDEQLTRLFAPTPVPDHLYSYFKP